MKYYIIAGEASGDLHASNLIKELVQLDREADIRFFGGERMLNACQGKGVLRKHYRDLAHMGIIEVLTHIRSILRNLSFCKKDIDDFEPDAIILVDCPGFNLRIAKFARKRNYRVYYYIAPQVWAWHTSRVKAIKRDCNRVYAILPFEQKFYEKYGVCVKYFGHPLLDEVSKYKFSTDIEFSRPLEEGEELICMLPGSRKHEVEYMLPTMLELSSKYKGYRFAVAATSNLKDLYHKYLEKYPNVELVYDRTYDLIAMSKAAVVKSGTSILETALIGTPFVCCYKTSGITYRLAKFLIGNKIRFISLVNLILDREVYKELIQNDFSVENISLELDKILKNLKNRERQVSDFEELKQVLKGSGASFRVAQSIIEDLKR